ncbi:class I adenylate-forming enzyme family protein [Mesorhizobium sp. B2-1-3A]|uniref:class I adenylate-forming enzyme family protein n=1 Tax=Mesorhizobium sp. B2-1-3A TaxID=2589971 RepID=UPI00112E1FF3|nr:class I adenylate-forming enzyme family protein [Mesorhizobium sp. B2-1-3A]TPM93639.1 acyl--CoA ligase [Mesorhizobium sp. B2-1-3A]
MGKDITATETAPPASRSLPDLLREQATLRPNALAVIGEHAQASFARLHERATRIAAALRRDGTGRTSRVGMLLGNGPEWLEIFFGASMAGAVVVPFSTWSTRAELEFLIGDSAITALFVRPRFLDRDFEADLDELSRAGRLGTLKTVVVLAPDTTIGLTMDSYLDGIGDPGAWPEEEGPAPSDDAVVLYTSGSTSRPKGVRLKHFGIIENGFNIGERQGLRPGDRVFLPTPLFWSYGAANALPATFSHGACLVLPDRFEPGAALSMIERTGCTAIYTLPAITNAMLRHPDFDRSRTRTLRTGLTIGSPRDFLAAVEDLGVSRLCNVYGATETYGNCAVTSHDWPLQRRANCQGEPLPGQKFRFRDAETGALLASGQPGLVEVSGYVSPGYSGASAALNAEIFTEDGYYRTGDVGFLDADGSFVFVGRDSDMIKRAGINISPAEIEDVMKTSEGVSQAAVVGVPDAERGELVVAYVVAKEGAAVSPARLLDHCRVQLSKYKLPDRIEVVEALPLTATGKLQRKELKKAATTLLAQELQATST